MLVGLDRAGGAVSGLVLGDGTAVLLRLRFGGASILAGGSLHHRAVRLGLGLGDGAVGVGGGARLAGRGGTASAAGRPIGNGQCSMNIGDLIIVI